VVLTEHHHEGNDVVDVLLYFDALGTYKFGLKHFKKLFVADYL
jgi:hypothetical protein